MGLGDPEDLIPGILIVVGVLALMGGLANYFGFLGNIPVLSGIDGVLHSGFELLANLLSPYLNFGVTAMAITLELILIILSIVIIVKVGI